MTNPKYLTDMTILYEFIERFWTLLFVVATFPTVPALDSLVVAFAYEEKSVLIHWIEYVFIH